MKRWGTWEELILGGAVVRHGTHNWNVVALELRARTIYPYMFTPEACKSKYENLQKRYSGCTSLFEELRKRRVAELKRELEKSEDSIGSLESKLGSLKAKKELYSQVGYTSSQTESPVYLPKTEVLESSGKDTSKDGLSAGSFTLDSGTKVEIKKEVLESCDQERDLIINKVIETSNEQRGALKKRRGKRKRKDCSKEASFGESDNLGSTNAVNASCLKETSTSDCSRIVRSCIDGQDRDLLSGASGDLIEIFSSIAESNHALGFKHRLDSQKRAKYKKIIRQHMDFDTLRSRIASCSIKSPRELFRDLLLLANNALVFYSRKTREYKSALSLRNHIMKAYRQHSKDNSVNMASSYLVSLSPMCNPPVRPRSVRPRPIERKLATKIADAESVLAWTPQGYKKLSSPDPCTLSLQPLAMSKKISEAKQEFNILTVADSNLPSQSLVMAKKGFSRPGMIGHGTAYQRLKATVTKERKRPRQRL